MSIEFPVTLYPAFAPLSATMANHLLRQEERPYLRRPAQRPNDSELIHTVLGRIARAETIVYKYLSPFVLADQKRQESGARASFPSPEWLLETLAQYAPNRVRSADATLDYWQKRGLLRRERSRGLLDITSVTALLIARLTERNHQKNWLPPRIPEGEPYWWCYGRASPHDSIIQVPLPIPSTFPASMVCWTQLKGAPWDREWWREPVITQEPEGPGEWSGDRFYRFAGTPSAADLAVWDEEISWKIQNAQEDSLYGREAVQIVLLEEARRAVLERVVQKGVCHD